MLAVIPRDDTLHDGPAIAERFRSANTCRMRK